MSNYLYRLAALAFRRRRIVLAVWLAAAIAAIAIAQVSGGKTNDNFTIPGTEAQHASDVLSAKLPAFSGGQSTIVFATTNGSGKVTDPAAKAAIETAMTKLESVPQVATVVDPFHGQLVSDSGKVALGQVQWSAKAPDVKDANLDAVKDAMTPVQADGVQVEYNGSVYPGWRTAPSETPELIGLIIAFVILMITFGAFAAAGMPILGAIVGVVTTLMGITAIASVLSMASASTTVALMLGLSCGIDYGLFILSRHRTNLLNGMTPEESAPLAMGTAGSAVVFAALTVIIALCGLTVVGIPFLTVMGLAAAASVAVALLIALTLLPAMLGFAGPKVATFTRLPLLGARAERVARRSAADPDSSAGAGWARFVVRHRVPVLIGGITLLGVLAIPAVSIHLGLPSGASQPDGVQHRRLGQAVQRPADLPSRRGRPGVHPAHVRIPDDPGADQVDPGLPALDGRGARRAGRDIPVGLGPAHIRHHPGGDDQLPADHHAGDHLRPVQRLRGVRRVADQRGVHQERRRPPRRATGHRAVGPRGHRGGDDHVLHLRGLHVHQRPDHQGNRLQLRRRRVPGRLRGAAHAGPGDHGHHRVKDLVPPAVVRPAHPQPRHRGTAARGPAHPGRTRRRRHRGPGKIEHL